MKLRVAVVGAAGRLGRFACECLSRDARFDLVARVDVDDDYAAVLAEVRPVVALDATRAGLGYEHATRMLDLGVRPLVGTSGVTPEENANLDAQARALGLGGLVVPNFSLGMCLLQRAAVEAARVFPRVEIVEMHHERKVDAPSGTALDTAERIRAANPAVPGVSIHSVRLPGHYAHQLVVFGGAGETYTLRHDMSGPEGFEAGIRAGCLHAARAVGVGRGLALALEA